MKLLPQLQHPDLLNMSIGLQISPYLCFTENKDFRPLSIVYHHLRAREFPMLFHHFNCVRILRAISNNLAYPEQ